MIDPCDHCPVAAGDGACYARRSNVRRLCQVDAYAPLLAEWGAEGGPGDEQAADAGEQLGFSPCLHRHGQWSCGGDLIAKCRLGLGPKGGIVDADDCLGCERIEPPPEAAP